ncbi:MAG: hypothetical protein FJ271_31425 [Planctomycetes bacterium]|nr:hypothetical protein [Planctomycetota bacterium]
MAIQFDCSCGKTIKAIDELQGKKCKCPKCGQVLTIPARAAKSAASAATFALAAEDDQPCPDCGQRLKPGAKTCTHCGFDFRTGRKAGEEGKLRLCSVCDAPLDADVDECPYCNSAGAALEKLHREADAVAEKPAAKPGRGARAAEAVSRTLLTRKSPVNPDKKLPAASALGELVREYRVSTVNSVMNIVLGGVASLIGLGIFIFVLSAPPLR